MLSLFLPEGVKENADLLMNQTIASATDDNCQHQIGPERKGLGKMTRAEDKECKEVLSTLPSQSHRAWGHLGGIKFL